VDESIWAVRLVEHAGKKVTEEKWSFWKKTEPGWGTKSPKPVGPGRPASPIKGAPPAPVFCRQASLSFLYLCAQVFVPRTTVDIAILPKLDSSNNSHT
jgi:hypothetical protein